MSAARRGGRSWHGRNNLQCRRFGYLDTGSRTENAYLIAAFRQGLSETGFIEDRNIKVEYRFAEGQYDRLPGLAAELVRREVAVIAAVGSVPSVLAAQAATATIPIVFTSGGDPLKFGLVTSLNRPNKNMTGVSVFSVALTAKRLEFLRELVPNSAVIAALVNPSNPDAEIQEKELQEGADTLGLHIQILKASSERDFDIAFASLIPQRVGALAVLNDNVFTTHRNDLVALSAHHSIPTIYAWREFAIAGGLMSYGASLSEMFRQVGVYAGKILKGAKSADLPVLLPTKFELVINLKTAKALGLTVPQTLLVAADEVIE